MLKRHKPIKFPIDESFHNCAVEWWYWNGHLKDKSGKEYSFMDCLFKVNAKKMKMPILEKISPKVSYFSHSIITDISSKKFYSKVSPISIVSDDSFSDSKLFINYLNAEIKNGYTNCIIEKIDESTYHIKNENVDLNLISTKKPILEGGSGFVDLKSKATYYYSLTNLKTKGKIKVGKKWIDVTGKSWMDHQWAESEYSLDKWDWFSVQLDNDTEMVCYVYDDGKTKTYIADVSYPNNKQKHFKKVEIIPLKKHWRSPKSKAVYPTAWKIKIPEKNIELDLTAKIVSQEMLFGSINYWEGPLSVKGIWDGKKVRGDSFMELVGYPSKYNNIKYVVDKIL
jgi:predicted secreted hydrolase